MTNLGDFLRMNRLNYIELEIGQIIVVPYNLTYRIGIIMGKKQNKVWLRLFSEENEIGWMEPVGLNRNKVNACCLGDLYDDFDGLSENDFVENGADLVLNLNQINLYTVPEDYPFYGGLYGNIYLKCEEIEQDDDLYFRNKKINKLPGSIIRQLNSRINDPSLWIRTFIKDYKERDNITFPFVMYYAFNNNLMNYFKNKSEKEVLKYLSYKLNRSIIWHISINHDIDLELLYEYKYNWKIGNDIEICENLLIILSYLLNMHIGYYDQVDKVISWFGSEKNDNQVIISSDWIACISFDLNDYFPGNKSIEAENAV